MEELRDQVRCPVCGCVPQHVPTNALHIMQRLSESEALVGPLLHDAGHLVHDAHTIFASMGDVISGEGTGRDVMAELLAQAKHGKRVAAQLDELILLVRRGFHRNRRVPLKALPREIKLMCEAVRLVTDVSFSDVPMADEQLINVDNYLAVFWVGITEALQYIRQDRRPDLQIALRVGDGHVATEFLLSHRNPLVFLDHEREPWGRLRWCVWLLGGTADVREEVAGNTSVSWRVPLVAANE